MVAVDIGYRTELTELRTFANTQDYPWPVGQADFHIVKAFGVKVQSTKFAINASGYITYRAGFGQGTNEQWKKVFKSLLD